MGGTLRNIVASAAEEGAKGEEAEAEENRPSSRWGKPEMLVQLLDGHQRAGETDNTRRISCKKE